MTSLPKILYHNRNINFDNVKLTDDNECMSIRIADNINDTFTVYIEMDYHFESFIFNFEYYTNPKYIRREIREDVYRYFEYKNTKFNTRRFERVLRCFSKFEHRSLFTPDIKSARKI